MGGGIFRVFFSGRGHQITIRYDLPRFFFFHQRENNYKSLRFTKGFDEQRNRKNAIKSLEFGRYT